MNEATYSEIYIPKPATVSECLSNVVFQLNNVRGWIGAGQTENAHIKARCLLEDVEKLVDAFAQEQLHPDRPSHHR